MKKFLMIFVSLILLGGGIFSQDFEVIIPSTDTYGGYISPVKPGASIQLEIKVTNKFKNSTISIQQYQLGEVQSWVSILNNSLQVDSSKTGVFDLTINVPTTAQDLNYPKYYFFTKK